MIGSQAAIADPRATVPCPTARARVSARWSATPTTVRPTVVVAPSAPIGAWAEASPSRSIELGLLVGSQEEIDRRVAAPQPGPVRLTDRAAGQHHAHPRVGGLEPGELAHPADHLLLGALADRAGVDDDEVGGLERRRLLAAGGQQAPGHLLRVAPVHLAAERPDVEARQGPRVGEVLGRDASSAGRHGDARGGARRPTDRASSMSRTGRARGEVGCHSQERHRTPKSGRGHVSSIDGTADEPRDLDRPRDADPARDRARHRQRHLHLDPRPAAARRPARSRPRHRPEPGDGHAHRCFSSRSRGSPA